MTTMTVVEGCTYLFSIGHVLNEQETGYKYSILIELKNGTSHLKEHPEIRKFSFRTWPIALA